MGKIISLINLKGGVGKTTTTVALAEFLTFEKGKKVLVIDLDPQTNATVMLINQEDLFSMGYNKKYVKEVIRNAKKQMQDKNTSVNEIKSKPVECDNITQIQKDVRDIKDLLISRQWDHVQDSYSIKSQSSQETLSDLLKILEMMKSNQQLLDKVNLEVKICIGDFEEEKSRITATRNGIIDKINPIEICREKGGTELKTILQTYDITTLKEIAKRYTPDSRGYVYKWTDPERIISYIVERSDSLSKKGSVFISD